MTIERKTRNQVQSTPVNSKEEWVSVASLENATLQELEELNPAVHSLLKADHFQNRRGNLIGMWASQQNKIDALERTTSDITKQLILEKERVAGWKKQLEDALKFDDGQNIADCINGIEKVVREMGEAIK